ncbi:TRANSCRIPTIONAL ADAPTER ADA2B [Salix koriyanagi]|uniref:Transcriptional adapter n=1 Tax=Salix koriyanagi TaxID=2511006 RepID=A0A9Q1AQ27_9ROSI|nr:TRANSCRIPTIONAL ADAPTER ADA2B [Salix koriyanagi]
MKTPLRDQEGKKIAASGENSESSPAGQGSSDGKRALYHCNYCNKDITGKTRIKCAVCPDFDLCLECFSVGAEVTPHKSNHPYRVMDNLSFPLICPDWNADEEILLLEGIEMYGLGNWAEVAEHVGTKNKETCIEHYNNIYMRSQCFPLPDMSHVVGKNRKELLAMAKGHSEEKKGTSMLGEHTLKEESPFSPSRVKVEEMHKVGSSGRLNPEVESVSRPNSRNSAATAANMKASSMARIKDGPGVKAEDPQVDRNFKGKKPSSSGSEGPSLMELSGYNPKRQEFDPEYDNDAEQLLAEMEFKNTDTEEERELKLRVLHIYSRRLDERKRRKDFILERNLLHPKHEELLQAIVKEHRILKKIKELNEAQVAGCHTAAEADRYLEHKRKIETRETSRRLKHNAQIGPSSQDAPNAFMSPDSVGKDSSIRPAGQGSSSYANDLYIMGFYETQLLSETEKLLCCEIHLPPPVYLKMQEVMTKEIFSGNITKKSDAHPLFKIEASKVDRVYDMLAKKGIAQA